MFKDNAPGNDWMISFRRRWGDRIRLRKPELLTKARAENLNQETLGKFFDMFHDVLSAENFFEDPNAADRIFNADETGFATDPNRRKMFFKKSSKDSYLLTPTCGKAYVYSPCLRFLFWYVLASFSCVQGTSFVWLLV